MSRFGSIATITWNEANTAGTFHGGSTIILNEGDMPQFPLEETRITDTSMFRTKSGKKWMYQNYSKVGLNLNWTNLNETKRDELAQMVYSYPHLAISSGGATLGTFLVTPDSITDEEVSYQLYNFSFDIEEE